MWVIRMHYGVAPPTAYDTEVVVAALGLCQRWGWPAVLAVVAMDAERPAAEEIAARHETALRRSVWPMVRAERPSASIMRSLRRVDSEFGCCLSTEELLQIGRDFIKPQRRR